LIIPLPGYAVCQGSFVNPITDVCWHCIFPIKFGGITVVPGIDPTEASSDTVQSPICVCPTPLGIPRPGIRTSFWEPARYIETVKDPFCFPSLGFGMPNPKQGFLGGDIDAGPEQGGATAFAQAHYFIFPVWSMMELLVDFVCVESGGFDLAYITEIDPLWNDDMLSMIIRPESLLFANLPAQTACMADSVAANAGQPLNPLFWCVGSWGSSYPMTGHTSSGDYVQANATIASRMLYKMARQGGICDPAVWECSCTPTPVWYKNHYKFHLSKPVRNSTCYPIGKSGLTWASGKNPPYAGDNFMWMIFRKRKCCAF
jgi:conjugal transfer pilus assembly protein TraU